jgi:NAD(P)-dependent dehydrogenase (short-subunit alcohol dehydrogenase family)
MMNIEETALSSLPTNFRAVIIGASGGLGAAIAAQIRMQQNAGEIVELSRSRNGFDLLDERSVGSAAASIRGPVHLLVCATGVLAVNGIGPEKTLRHLDPEIMLAQFRTNTVGPALVAKHFLPLLDQSFRSIALFLSARVGSIGDNKLGGWVSYRAAKAALNQVVKTAAIEASRTHRHAVIAAVHPGTVRTALSDPYSRGHKTVSPDAAARNIICTADRLKYTGVFLAYDGTIVDW